MGYSFRLAVRVLLYASSNRRDNAYHSLCYTSRGALAGMRNSSMGPPHEGSIRRPIAPWANDLTTELHIAPDMKEHFSVAPTNGTMALMFYSNFIVLFHSTNVSLYCATSWYYNNERNSQQIMVNFSFKYLSLPRLISVHCKHTVYYKYVCGYVFTSCGQSMIGCVQNLNVYGHVNKVSHFPYVFSSFLFLDLTMH